MNSLIKAIGISLVLLVILLLMHTCNQSSTIQDQNRAIGSVRDSILFYKDSKGRINEYNHAIQLTDPNQVPGLKKELADLKIKKATVVIKYQTVFKTDTLHFHFVDSIPCPKFERDFEVDSPYVSVEGKVTNTGIVISTIEVPNEMLIAVGSIKHPWYQFKKDTVAVVVRNTNSHVKGKQIEPYLFTPSPKFYNTAWFKFSALASAFIFGGILIQ